jgi:hypothetical protein
VTISALVEDALACVANECPPAYAAMEHAFGTRRLDIAIDDEHFMLDLGTPSLHGSVISIVSRVDTIRDLILGNASVLDAIEREQLEIVASPDDLVAAADAMTHFLQGALRCVSMPALLDRLVALRKEPT